MSVLLLHHLRANLLELLRTPAFSVVTVLLPSVIFIFIGSSVAQDRESANFVMASFAIFAALGVAFFQFGVGIANQRESAWESFVRVLPVSVLTRFAANVATALVFCILAVGLLAAVALLLTEAALPAVAWMRLLAAVFAGAIPMGLLGIAVGYWSPPKAALPIANILYLALSFGGGLFIAPQSMPGVLNAVSRVLPTRHIAELAWASVLGQPWPVDSWLWLAGYTVVFGGAAVVGYRRDEGARYR